MFKKKHEVFVLHYLFFYLFIAEIILKSCLQMVRKS